MQWLRHIIRRHRRASTVFFYLSSVWIRGDVHDGEFAGRLGFVLRWRLLNSLLVGWYAGPRRIRRVPHSFWRVLRVKAHRLECWQRLFDVERKALLVALQKQDFVDPPVVGLLLRHVHWRLSLPVFELRVCSVFHQQLYSVWVSLSDRTVKCRVAIRVLSVHEHALLVEQKAERVEITATAGEAHVECALPARVGRVQVDAAAAEHQILEQWGPVKFHRHVERSALSNGRRLVQVCSRRH